MSGINQFKAPVKEEFIQYKSFYKNALKSKTKIVDLISGYIHTRKKNEIVPLLTLLSAKLGGNVNENTYVAATVIDFLSTATFIHDDVAEENPEKKDYFRIKTLWQSKLSVLMGDYFLAKGLLLSVENKSYSILEIISKAVKEITEGELYNLNFSRKLNITRDEYFEIVNKKTAALMAASTSVGYLSVNPVDNKIQNLINFGKNYGIAYHIKNDLKLLNEKKTITAANLPLIIALENSTEEEKNEILLNEVFSYKEQNIKKVQNFIKTKKGTEIAETIINEYEEKAIAELSAFESSAVKETLINLVRA
jgi:octaprenyl-diphosphate synthase